MSYPSWTDLAGFKTSQYKQFKSQTEDQFSQYALNQTVLTNLQAQITNLYKMQEGTTNAGGEIYRRVAWDNFTSHFEVYSNSTNPDTSNIPFTTNTQGFLVGSEPFTGGFNQHIQTRFKTCDSDCQIDMEFEFTSTRNTDSYGLSLGLVSVAPSYRPSAIVFYDGSTNTDGGKVKIYNEDGGITELSANIGTPKVSASSGLTPTINHLYRLTMVVKGIIIEARIANLTTGASFTTRLIANLAANKGNLYLPNTSRIFIGHQGGGHIIRSLTVKTNQPTNPDILCLGDSKTRGYSAESYALTYPSRLAVLTNADVSVHAGDGDTTVSCLAQLPYLLDYCTPKYVCLCIGRNDLLLSPAVSTATWQSNYAQIVALLLAKGVLKIFHILPIPEPGNQDALKTYISTTYPNSEKHHLLDPSLIWVRSMYLSTDNIHPNATGMFIIAQAIQAALADYGISF